MSIYAFVFGNQTSDIQKNIGCKLLKIWIKPDLEYACRA